MKFKKIVSVLCAALTLWIFTGVALGAGLDREGGTGHEAAAAAPLEGPPNRGESQDGTMAAAGGAAPGSPEAPEAGSDRTAAEEKGSAPAAGAVDPAESIEAEKGPEAGTEAAQDDEAGEQAGGPDDLSEETDLLNLTGYEVMEDGVSAVVTNFAQLKEATEGDNGIVNIYLGADVTLEQNRTVIPASKAEYRLSGMQPGTDVRHTITEFKTTGQANIVVPNGNSATKRVTMEDMDIINQGDYYGLIGVEDGNTGVEMVVRNVDFTGRQFAYNRYGHLVFEGNNHIDIPASINGVAGQEIAEALHVTIRGSLESDFQSVYPVFNLTSGAGTFTVEGSFIVNAPKIAPSDGVIKGAGGTNAVRIETRPGAEMRVSTSGRFVNDIADSLTVGAGSVLHYERVGGSYAAIKLRQRLTVGEGATLYFGQGGPNVGYLFRFEDAPASLDGGVMEFYRPRLVTLIDGGSYGMVYGVRNEQFNVTTQYLEYWDGDGEPVYSFSRAGVPGEENISIRMVHRAGIPSSLETNHSEITKEKLRLDKTAKKIVFGQENSPGIREAVIRFSAQNEETGEQVADFSMPDMVAAIGEEVKIEPQQVAGYVATGYSVNGGAGMPLEEGGAPVTPQDEKVAVVFYYAEPIVEVSVPVKMIFAAYESDGGVVTSPTFSFENHSRFAVDVSLSGVAFAGQNGGIPLAGAEDPGEGERLWLAIHPLDAERFNSVDMTQAHDEKEYIGRLLGRGEEAGRKMEFLLAGKYFGDFTGDAKWPAYDAEFTFEIS